MTWCIPAKLSEMATGALWALAGCALARDWQKADEISLDCGA
jgi:hypothetical protein